MRRIITLYFTAPLPACKPTENPSRGCISPGRKTDIIWYRGGGGGGGGVLPYLTYTGICRWTGYGCWPFCPEQGI